MRNNAGNKTENIVVETFSLSSEFTSNCICQSCSLVITHASSNGAYEKDAIKNAAEAKKKKREEVC